jgi:hypothetical protein
VLRRILAAAAPLAAALALVVPMSAPAQAAPLGSELTLLWSRWNGTDEPHHIATLNCGLVPAIGTHPNPIGACLALTLAGGDPDNLLPDLRFCTNEYDPVGALIVGTWGTRAVFWTGSYDNPCKMAKQTGGVMSFT